MMECKNKNIKSNGNTSEIIYKNCKIYFNEKGDHKLKKGFDDMINNKYDVEDEEDEEVKSILDNEDNIIEHFENNLKQKCYKINNMIRLLNTLKLHLKNKNIIYISKLGNIDCYNKAIKQNYVDIHKEYVSLVKLQYPYSNYYSNII
jgi:hypothetical protein